jgi:hypothetical protein
MKRIPGLLSLLLVLILAIGGFLLPISQRARAEGGDTVSQESTENRVVGQQGITRGEPSSVHVDLFVASRQKENAGRDDPDVPWGEAQEEYTGTKEFGGIAGSGITGYGTLSR